MALPLSLVVYARAWAEGGHTRDPDALRNDYLLWVMLPTFVGAFVTGLILTRWRWYALFASFTATALCTITWALTVGDSLLMLLGAFVMPVVGGLTVAALSLKGAQVVQDFLAAAGFVFLLQGLILDTGGIFGQEWELTGGFVLVFFLYGVIRCFQLTKKTAAPLDESENV